MKWFIIVLTSLVLVSCSSPEEHMTDRRVGTQQVYANDPPLPIYCQDPRTGICFINFIRLTYVQPMETECTPGVLAVIEENRNV